MGISFYFENGGRAGWLGLRAKANPLGLFVRKKSRTGSLELARDWAFSPFFFFLQARLFFVFDLRAWAT